VLLDLEKRERAESRNGIKEKVYLSEAIIMSGLFIVGVRGPALLVSGAEQLSDILART